jgi:Flp pilus assembly protein TadD
LDGAIVAYREAIRLEPQFKSAHNNLGIALAKSGDLDGAIRSFERAVELEPDNPQYKRGLALARMQKAERDAKATQVAPAAAGGEALAAGVSAFREP